MSQFITVQVGQCGNQIGSAFWPLALHEYGIQTSNTGMNLLKTQRNRIKSISDLCDTFDSFFFVPDNPRNLCFKSITDLERAKVKARAILIDMEDSVVGELKKGPIRNLFDKTCIVTNYPGSGNNWAVGHYTHGMEYHERLEDTIRRSVEKCCRLHGFLIAHSLGGGTGSGLGTAVLKLLTDDYPTVDRLVSCVYPTVAQDVITAPYNALLATKELVEHATCVFPIENESLLNICDTQLKQKSNRDQINYNNWCKPFQDMNSVVVNMLLHLTSGSRFPGSLNMDMNEIPTNLVVYPKLHYIFSSVSPLALTAPTTCNIQGTKLLDELFVNAWSRNNQLINVDPLQRNSLILSAAHIARGNCSMNDLKRNVERHRSIIVVGASDVTFQILRFQRKVSLPEWSKEAMKIGLCSVPPPGHSSSLLCLLNSSSMSLLFENLVKQFSKLYRRKAHVYHYTQVRGFEETYFLESKEIICDLIAQYAELESEKQPNISRLEIL